MKFFHISDLHIGKKLREVDISKDQEHILNEIIKLADKERPDAFLIAGDIYDRSVPSANAINLFDDFITELESRN
ncbi:MAG TPA: exonuclease SbcCD subunit D, partial [Clostridiales bacterium]|nr:exonuclease SbcCD subunit D [Clostridiales bacterium]